MRCSLILKRKNNGRIMMERTMEATNLQPGEWVAEKKAIFIGELDDLVRADIPVALAHTANLRSLHEMVRRSTRFKAGYL